LLLKDRGGVAGGLPICGWLAGAVHRGGSR
jgi:hypothetical protein